MLVATVDSEELRPYLGLVGTITEVDDAKEKFSLRFERADNGGNEAEEVGVKWGSDVSGFSKGNIGAGSMLYFVLNPQQEVVAELLRDVPNAELWQLRVFPTDEYAGDTGGGSSKVIFVFLGVEEEAVEATGEVGDDGYRPASVKKPRQLVEEALPRIKGNIERFLKAQVDPGLSTSSEGVRIFEGTVDESTFADGFIYAPDLPYGPAGTGGLAGIGSTWERVRLAMRLNHPNEAAQMDSLRAMIDTIKKR